MGTDSRISKNEQDGASWYDSQKVTVGDINKALEMIPPNVREYINLSSYQRYDKFS